MEIPQQLKDIYHQEMFIKFQYCILWCLVQAISFNTHAIAYVLYSESVAYYEYQFTEEIAWRKDPQARLKTVSAETRDILQELEREYKAPEAKEDKKEVHLFVRMETVNN